MLNNKIDPFEARHIHDNCEMPLERYFHPFRHKSIGVEQPYMTHYGKQMMLYADWAASGRLYQPIESVIAESFGPYMANTHTDSSHSGQIISQAYQTARQIIKKHVHANNEDVLLLPGAGMTSAINKLQRLLGLKVPTWLYPFGSSATWRHNDRPVIFVSHMEHHSNHISWEETVGEVIVVDPDSNGEVCPNQLRRALKYFQSRSYKIGAFTACSNVTGLTTPYHSLAKAMHEYGGLCFIDFSASAPYVPINMHPDDPLERLDGITFSPHKFLGGPGSCGVLVLHASLCSNPVPDHAGGGTVEWVNPWGTRRYIRNIEKREDGGTPPILQSIRAALCINLKEKMGLHLIKMREAQLTALLLKGLQQIPNLIVLESDKVDRLGIVSFNIANCHYNLVVKMLSDRYGIQTRGGCSCAGPYGHYLLGIAPAHSHMIEHHIAHGDNSMKPGWVRVSLHPIMTNEEITRIISAIAEIAYHYALWRYDYHYNSCTNEWTHIHDRSVRLQSSAAIQAMFDL
ncbi:selenocysteine lyase/cysteine desulfurase [Fontibacillus solani]|uniref:Selenocysteine lyase/cysteine desulfurase n=2 Tax=Fontibacillus solani TaxID=1572857 RepID=A0A7W3SQQ4_9BACL|nr:selenocysteine lyase/cysteine desulfurase [Fontibacillus solani]